MDSSTFVTKRCASDPFQCDATLKVIKTLSWNEFVSEFDRRGYQTHTSFLYAVYTGPDGACISHDKSMELIAVEWVAYNACFVSMRENQARIAEKDGVFVAHVPGSTSHEHITMLRLRNLLGPACVVYRVVTAWPVWKLVRIPDEESEFVLDGICGSTHHRSIVAWKTK